MTATQIRALEEALGLTFPAAYNAAQLAYPQALNQFEESDGGGDPADVYWFFRRARNVLDYNESHRADMKLSLAGGELADWPPHMLVIGREGSSGGDFFCLDTSKNDETVYRFDHEEGIFKPFRANLSEYLAWLQHAYETDALLE